MYHSAASLLTVYGDLGRSGADSGVGTISAPPYTLLDDANTTRRTPASADPLSTARVPWTLTVSVVSGSATERGTAPSAPSWNTSSVPATAVATVAGSASEPTTSSASGCTFSLRPVERSSSTRTPCPAATSASTRCEPMKPAPPVTSTFMGAGP